MSTTVTTPVGRILKSDIITGSSTDANNNPLMDKSGQPIKKYWMHLGISKQDPGLAGLMAAIQQEAADYFRGGEQNAPGFSWKYYDGDLNPDGTVCTGPSAGHVVFRLSTQFAPQILKDQGGVFVATTDIKNGDYCRVAMGIAAHKHPQRSSMFLNLNMIQFIGHGEPINTGGIDPSKAFGTPVGYMPAGCSQTPVVSGAMPSMVAPIAQPVVPVAQPVVPVAQPVVPVAQPVVPVAQTLGQNFTNKI